MHWLHKWDNWKIIQVDEWVSFLPKQSNMYGIYSTADYKGPAGQMVKRDVQQRLCLKCGKVQRSDI